MFSNRAVERPEVVSVTLVVRVLNDAVKLSNPPPLFGANVTEPLSLVSTLT